MCLRNANDYHTIVKTEPNSCMSLARQQLAMDWLKLFALLVAVASITIQADGPKKKIRIHLPQKVKHIHHHKKIYITNHPATSQYAPAYMPSAEGSVSVPNIAMPALVPLNSVELYDETQARLPGVSAAAAQLLPLYHARGYYGPTNTEIEEEEYEALGGQESEEYVPSFSSPSPPSRPKRVKIIKINEPPRKKVVRKVKPKRVAIRKPQQVPVEGEHPVSTFHEQFYSDIDGSGTIKKIKKPPRVEKIIDGDTEHIHTYSEEHIHKMMFDDGHKVANVFGVDPLTGMSAIAGAQQVIPLKNGHALVAVPANPFAALSAVGALGAPSHFEYAAYNPREVTHDHIFHDHGEIPSDVEINKEALGLPPKVSFNNQGLRVSGNSGRSKIKHPQRLKKPTKPTPADLSYYEGIYTPATKPKKASRPKIPVSNYESDDVDLSNFRPVPDFGFRDKRTKPRAPVGTYYSKSNNDYRQQSSPPAPFSVSSTVVHDYKPNSYSSTGSTSASLTKYKDTYGNLKDSYSNNFEYESYAPSSNIYTSEDKNDVAYETQGKRGKKKSVSTQNISFGNQDHISILDHLNNGESDLEPTALDNIDKFGDQSQTDIDILRPSSAVHQYYAAMAAKAFEDPLAVPEASNDNFEYVEAPISSTTPLTPSAATPSNEPQYLSETESTSEATSYVIEIKQRPKETKNINTTKRENQNMDRYAKNAQTLTNDYQYTPAQSQERSRTHDQDSSTVRGKLKYGDKI